MTSSVILALLAATLLVAVVGIAVMARASSSRSLAYRRAKLNLRRPAVGPGRSRFDKLVSSVALGRSVSRRLDAAGRTDLLAGDVVAVALLAAAGVIYLLSSVVTVGAATVVALGLLLVANQYLNYLVQKRIDAFSDQLPDIALVMSNAAGAGIAIPNALQLTANEMAEPAASLLQHAVRELAVGASLADAMDSLKERVPSREMSVLVSTLIIQQRAGGDVIEALREMSTNLEQRRDLRREVRTVMSGVRFTAYAIMGLGTGSLLLIESLRSGTLQRMTSSLAGQLILIAAFGFFFIGFLAVRRLSRVDV
ncbi:type II secretion system F family protein [Euzebya tangerina]|uniref:type II secretion system F family protein n=1 Tax=Euzebya tangerina TaxID=591198 RepID=UPI000E31F8FE|nr:type II secretion system F family protein [Euzebya tangerina]